MKISHFLQALQDHKEFVFCMKSFYVRKTTLDEIDYESI